MAREIFVNNESKHTIQVIDVKTWKATASWPLAPCEGPTGIANDKAWNRIFSGCNKTSVAVDASTGKVVASIPNGTRVDALGWDPEKKLIRRQPARPPAGPWSARAHHCFVVHRREAVNAIIVAVR